jgi:FKBP-type peptidyl-prolyl cis-trans isomerase
MNTVTPVGVAVGLAVVVALAFLFFGSGIFAPFSQPAAVATTTAAVTQNAIMQDQNANQNSDSLQITDSTVGTGAVAEAGDTVTVDYVGQLTDGTVFDASKNHGTSGFTFTLGAGQVIQGWDQGVAGMKVGGVRTLVIPAALGYGAQAVGPIPANSTLVFQVTLLDVKKGQ